MSGEEPQPSQPLIAILHRQLHDPSIVPRFESGRQLAGLIRPHWMLCTHTSDDDDSSEKIGTSSTDQSMPRLNDQSSLISKKTNSIPKRSYIDLRIQQNRRFADERCQQYTKLHSDWNTRDYTANNIGKANSSRSKQLEMMKSCVKEGLAAYPDHEGLIFAQKQINELHANQLTKEVIPPPHSKFQSTSQQKQTIQTSKGVNLKAERRAHAAIRDALLERNFLSDGASASASGGAGNYTLLPEEDTVVNNRPEEDMSVESSNSDESRRRRKERKRKKEKYKKKRKKHHRKSRKRSRSPSVSRSKSTR